MILRGDTNEEMRQAARGHGMVALRDAGMEFAFNGTTTIDEVIRETIMDA
jgi:type IV pilus assembly protein PilB